MIDVADLRRSYQQGGLDEKDLPAHPMELFEKWLQQAIDSKMYDPNGVVVSTVDQSGQPYSRMVLLKDYTREELIFYTNLGSRKAEQIKGNPKICMLFPWYMLERQVMFIGEAHRQSPLQDLKYFHSRPRGSQIGAWTSHQSHLISARGVLEGKFLELKEKFKNGEIPLPSFWGGYRVKFTKVEFWQGRETRLHARVLYDLEDGVWQTPKRLAP